MASARSLSKFVTLCDGREEDEEDRGSVWVECLLPRLRREDGLERGGGARALPLLAVERGGDSEGLRCEGLFELGSPASLSEDSA